MEYNFKLTLEYKNSPPVTANKTINAQNNRNAWAAAKRWQNNCLAICGKNHLGESYHWVELELLNNKELRNAID